MATYLYKFHRYSAVYNQYLAVRLWVLDPKMSLFVNCILSKQTLYCIQPHGNKYLHIYCEF